MKAIEIKKDIYWAGALDPNLRVFDIIMYTPYGTTYNSYIVKGSKKTAVFETVKEKFFDDYINKLRSLDIDVENIDYIIVDHTEPDHAGSVVKLLDIAKNAKVVGSPTAIKFMEGIMNIDFQSIIVNDGDTLDLGNKTLRFISAPFLHWPDSMYTYVEEDKVIITCDSFGSHYCNNKIFNDLNESDENYREALKYYFDNIMGPFKPYVLKAIEKIEKLPIDMICPGHGPILRENPLEIVEQYKKWSSPPKTLEEDNQEEITLCYVSAYGYTGVMAEKIIEGIKSCGNYKVNSYDVINHNMDDILSSIGRSKGVLFGTPTINGDALKPIWDIMICLNPLVHGGKVASAFGSYGWSGEGVPNIVERLKQLRMDIVPSLSFNFKPSHEDLKTAFKFGESFVEKIKEKTSKGVKPNSKTTSKLWKCIVCGEIFEGNTPPEVCPACGAGAEQFIEVTEEIINFHSDKEEKFVIIGNGAAGYYASEAIRKRNKRCEIEIISQEPYLSYYRPTLSDGLNEDIPKEKLFLSPASWYEENNIKLTLDANVINIDTKNKRIILKDKSEVNYDKLILANGSSNFIPPVKGNEKNGVFTLKNIKDLNDIRDYMKESKKAIVIGGGLLGLEAAWEMKLSGLEVTVIEMADYLLSKQLDTSGAKILHKSVEDSGIKALCSSQVVEIKGDNSVSSVLLKDGTVLEADIVLFSIGIRSNIQITKGTNIQCGKGILVNNRMETSEENIYACGDVCEIENRIYGNWPAAKEMGTIAGTNAVGDTKCFSDFIESISFNAVGVELFSCGVIPKESNEVIALNNPDKKVYKKFFFQNNRLVAAILMGDTSKSIKVLGAIENGDSMDILLKQDIL